MEIYKSLPKEIQNLISKYCDSENVQYYQLIEYAYHNKLPIYSYEILKRICYEHKKRIFLKFYTDKISKIAEISVYQSNINNCADLFNIIMNDLTKGLKEYNERDVRRFIYSFEKCDNFNYNTLSCDCGLLDGVFIIINNNNLYEVYENIENYDVLGSIHLTVNINFNLLRELEKRGKSERRMLFNNY